MTGPKPFSATAGRDSSRDQPLPLDVARWYYEQRHRVLQDAPALRQLIEAVDWSNDLWPSQWAQWYSLVLGFRPDLVLELGRGRGNSTALFCQAAAALGGTRVVSLCHSGDWTTLTAPRLMKVVGPGWFEPLDARMTDILSADYAEILGDHRRVLLLWDAHGFEIAEVVLGEILPRLLDREHLVVMHDILDNRYARVARSYEGQPLWKGSAWQKRSGCADARVNIGWMHSIQDQVIAIADFSARNDLAVQSADHDYAQFFAAHPARADEMDATLGDEFFSTIAQWAYFSLTGLAGPFEFPSVAGHRVFANSSPVVVEGFDRMPAIVCTRPQAWSFASAWKWRPATPVPAGVEAAVRVRLHIEGGSVGVGLLAENGTDFLVRRAAAPTRSRLSEIVLPVTDMTKPGPIVIQTWAAPISARVHVEDIELVW